MGAFHEVTAGAVRRGRTRGVLGLTAAVAAVALGGVGCQSVAKSRAEMMRAVGLGKSMPPAQFICIVEPNVIYQPDTTRNGQPSPLMLGKVYLFGADQKPVTADGQVTVVLNDTTIRPPGVPQRDRSIVHIDEATLKRLGANDERFGRHYVIPLPWPEGWGDVTHVTVQARYSPNKALGVPDLFNPESRFAVNPGTTPIFDQKTGQPITGPNPAIPTAMGVPDPNQLLKQFAGGGLPAAAPTPGFPNSPPTLQAGNFVPPVTTNGPNGSKVTTGAWALPVPAQPQPQPQPPANLPPAVFGSQPLMPVTLPPAPGASSQPFVWPPPGGQVPPPVGPIGELRPDGALTPVVIPRQ